MPLFIGAANHDGVRQLSAGIAASKSALSLETDVEEGTAFELTLQPSRTPLSSFRQKSKWPNMITPPDTIKLASSLQENVSEIPIYPTKVLAHLHRLPYLDSKIIFIELVSCETTTLYIQ